MSRRSKVVGKGCEPAVSPVAKMQRYIEPIGLALIVLATFVVYWPAVHGTPLIDDNLNITKPELQWLEGLYRIWFDPSATREGQYYPFSHSAFWVEHLLWGDAYEGYQLVNVLWHSCSVLLIYAIVNKLKIPGALLASAIFALHPVMVESIAWMCEQKNTLSTVFYLSALLAYLNFDPDAQINYAILIYRLGAADLDRALDGPPVELEETESAAAE